MPDEAQPDEAQPEDAQPDEALPDDFSELSPSDEARVRRLLAEARHTEPMPGAVVARLDAVLAGLAAEGTPTVAAAPSAASAPTPVGVADLDARRRRRRRGATFLVAAAAVTAFGVSAGPLLQNFGSMSSNDSQSTADAGGDFESAKRDAGATGKDKDHTEAAMPSSSDAPEVDLGAEADGVDAYGFEGPLPTSTVSPRAFRRQAALLSQSATMYDVAGLSKVHCPGVRTWGQGRALPAAYAGKMGLLIFRSPRGARQRVDLYLCGSLQPARSTLIPLP
jgi:hypothetical protein